MNCQLSDIFNTGHCSRRAFKKQYNCYNLVEIDVSVNEYTCYISAEIQDIIQKIKFIRAFKNEHTCYNLAEIDISVKTYTCYISAEIQGIIQKVDFIRAFRNEYTCYYLTEVQGIVPES